MSTKKKFLKSKIDEIRNNLTYIYINKYYNLFMNSFKWDGISYEEQDYIMRQLWSIGTVSAFSVKGEVIFAGYAAQEYNIYDFPEKVMIINKRGVPFFPHAALTVNEDVALCWAQSNHKPIKEIVESYIDRLVQVDMVINTNLNIHKMPFLVGITPTDKAKAEDIVKRILNDEVVVFMDAEELNMVQTLTNGSPYIIDKLYNYRVELENELLTYLGLDNNAVDKKERLIVDEVNANNQLINANRESLQYQLESFCEKIQEIFNFAISVEPTLKPVESIHDEEQPDEEVDNA